MVNNRLKQLIDKVIGEVGAPLGNGEDVRYHCPFCKNHSPNRKFEVNLNPDVDTFGRYGCWVCKHSNDSTGTNLHTLLSKLQAKAEYVRELKSLLRSLKIGNFDKITYVKPNPNEISYSLPDEYMPLWEKRNSPDYKNALCYVKRRGCTDMDIIRYNIGYCESGEYESKIIIPSYDAEGNLNFFTSRNFYESEFNKHKNPNWTKNIIGFELFINWRVPLILVEGGFDAIAVKRNVIPLFGKNISEKLQNKILQEKVTDIYMALDPDAIRDNVPITKLFMGYGINTYIVKLPDDNDPSKLGYEKFMNLINNSKKATFKELIQFKLKGMK